MTNQTKNNNINYLIDPTFIKVNRLLVLLFENENDRTSFSKYYVPNIQIKDFNVLINGKSLFNMPIKNSEGTYEKIIEMGRNSNYTRGNFLDYEYFSKHYKLIPIDLSKKIKSENTDLKQQINLIGRLLTLTIITISVLEEVVKFYSQLYLDDFLHELLKCCNTKNLMFQKEFTLIKKSASKECMLCYYWLFKDAGFKFERHVFNKCHDLLMTAYELIGC